MKSIGQHTRHSDLLLFDATNITSGGCNLRKKTAEKRRAAAHVNETLTVKAFSHIIFWGAGQHNSYVGKSMRPLHIMVTSTMSNRLGEGCILMVLKQERCCKSFVFTLVNVQGEGFWLDFVATDQLSTRCRHTKWHARLPECDPRSSRICRDAVECSGTGTY